LREEDKVRRVLGKKNSARRTVDGKRRNKRRQQDLEGITRIRGGKQPPRKAKTATKKSVKEIVDLIQVTTDGDDDSEDDNDLNDDNATTRIRKNVCLRGSQHTNISEETTGGKEKPLVRVEKQTTEATGTSKGTAS
jgi:hypothetical protein